MSHQDGKSLEYSAQVSADEAAGYFESLAAGIRQHQLLVESGNESIDIGVGDSVKLQAEFRAADKKSSIMFGLSWRPEAAHAADQPAFHVVTGDDLVEREPTLDTERTDEMAHRLAEGDGRASATRASATRASTPATSRRAGTHRTTRERKPSSKKTA